MSLTSLEQTFTRGRERTLESLVLRLRAGHHRHFSPSSYAGTALGMDGSHIGFDVQRGPLRCLGLDWLPV